MDLGINDITSIARATAHRVLSEDITGRQSTAETVDATPTVLQTIAVDDNTAGMVFVYVAGFSGTDGITGAVKCSFRKIAGTLTIGTVYDELTTLADDGEAFAISVSSGNLIVTVTGTASAYSWIVEHKILTTFKEVAPP